MVAKPVAVVVAVAAVEPVALAARRVALAVEREPIGRPADQRCVRRRVVVVALARAEPREVVVEADLWRTSGWSKRQRSGDPLLSRTLPASAHACFPLAVSRMTSAWSHAARAASSHAWMAASSSRAARRAHRVGVVVDVEAAAGVLVALVELLVELHVDRHVVPLLPALRDVDRRLGRLEDRVPGSHTPLVTPAAHWATPW